MAHDWLVESAYGSRRANIGDGPISIGIRDQTGEETFLKMQRSTKMLKAFNAYARRKGAELSSLQFLLDGVVIYPTESDEATPMSLDLDDMEQIDCML